MALWGKSTSAESRPKWLGGDGAEGASGRKEDAHAVPGGWAMRAGQPNTGNDNTSAQVEIIACLSAGHASGLSGALGAANLLSVDFTATTTLAHDGSGTFDLVYTFDEAITITSTAWSADQVISNKVHVGVQCLGPTDMASDVAMQLQYYSGSGTNRLVFRGTVPAAAVTDGYIADLNGTYAMATNGSSAAVDANGTTVAVADADHDGGSAAAGVDGSSAIWGTDVTKTGSSVNTLTTQAGSSSGSVAILTGVQFA